MRDDEQFIEWLEIQRQIFALIVARREVTTTKQFRAYNTAIDTLSRKARPYWDLLSVRYAPADLDRAAREVYQEVRP